MAASRPGAASRDENSLQDGAPRYPIPQRRLGASPFCKPLMSHNARTHNVVLKVTVPRRTGRKRKRGTNGPWQADTEAMNRLHQGDQSAQQICSHGRLDDPRTLQRKLADNVGRYEVEAVGTVRHTHRFRGLADFYWVTSERSDFARRYTDQVLPGNVEDLKEFKFRPGIDKGPNVDVLPPPVFTHMNLPFNYFYSQNPYVRVTDDGQTFNATAVKHVGHFIGAEDPPPSGPQHAPDMTDPRTVEVMAELESAFDERPVWTRRSLMNHLGGKLRNWTELKRYLNYAAYQFKGGPWRDGVVPYGLDPRTDPKYRIYQTVMFKLLPRNARSAGDAAWRSIHDHGGHDDGSGRPQGFHPDPLKSHIFDGQTYHLDGKVWQVCDITDPLLRDLLDKAAVRPTRDPNSGWYHGGLWAKAKAIMKTKMIAIRFGRDLSDRDFAATLDAGDQTPVRPGTVTTTSSSSVLPLPDLRLTDDELRLLRGRNPAKRTKHAGYSMRVRNAEATSEGAQAVAEEEEEGEQRGEQQAASVDERGEGVEGATPLAEFAQGGSENESGSESGSDLQEGDDDGYEYPDVPV
ncbi:hypothetical protein GMORB2_2690 [Geosmithia morbida]|uniref:Uncharacterized protein n=1 Tax=Geosmithia morbida TaxID=1094350 RepID=A0A9P4YS77_9HYPO|nr:uncharacterized protein GMORB2_2690 [Geosmithia morbida]KAF4120686.1 hypothetical protein GMORB2_2690 [Geosmithia morbida]